MTDREKLNRPLSKLACAEEFEGDMEHITAAYSSVREDSSTGSTYKLPAEVEFRKGSNEEVIYRIIAFKENFNNSNKTAVKLQVINSSRSFYCLVEDVYNKNWLNNLTKEDCTYLAVLYVAENKKDPSIISRYPRKHVNMTTSVLILSVLYTGCLILSNIAGSKIISLGNWITLPAVLAFFPLTYILDDIITEVYGFRVSRKIIWSALVSNIIVAIGAFAVVKLPPSLYWHNQDAFEKVFLESPRILCASMLAYIFGEFFNSVALAKIKIHTKGKYLWFRSVLSTSVGSIFDSIIFCTIGFLGIIPNDMILSMIITQYIVKISYAICALPLVYKITNFLKKLDKVDTYDFTTKFNPFSF